MRTNPLRLITLISLVLLLSACQSPGIDQSDDIAVHISADGGTEDISIPSGSTVSEALDFAAITLSTQDRVEPPGYTVLASPSDLLVIRVVESFETTDEVVPFERQELLNESMTTGESRLIQAGQNGIRQITVRTTYENGTETTRSVVSETTFSYPVSEIIMVGVQNPFTTIDIPGNMAFLTAGNAWIIEGSSANRRPLVTSGDLDGRVFSLSPDHHWLLFTRKSSRPAEQEINTLWVIDTTQPLAQPINLRISNIIHFADWRPGEPPIIAYSTVEPRLSAPGWQANNDLYTILLNPQTGQPGTPDQVLEPSSGGVYGWWGTSYSWSPGGQFLAYSRPDGVGLVDFTENTLDTLVDIIPLNTYGDWAWIPGLAWGSDEQVLFFVSHAPPTGLASLEESPFFNLEGISLTSGSITPLIENTGMFAYPATSAPSANGNEEAYLIASLQAIFPSQSATSRYRLVIMDRDGSEQQNLFPAENQTGLEPQVPHWAPAGTDSLLALIYGGNIWIIDSQTGYSHQISGDGLTSQLDWK